MTDKEYLELAAKAAGIEIQGWDGEHAVISDPYTRLWNPLIDDGDALRLAVKLKLNIEQWEKESNVYVGLRAGLYSNEHYLDDPYAATRRAIVGAAAEMGKEVGDVNPM